MLRKYDGAAKTCGRPAQRRGGRAVRARAAPAVAGPETQGYSGRSSTRMSWEGSTKRARVSIRANDRR
jgi:hypothetical protein